jgi:hypothetical protein
MIRDELIATAGELKSESLPGSGTITVNLGKADEMDGVFIDYKTIVTMTSPLDSRSNETGHIEVNVSYKGTYTQGIHHTRESTHHYSGGEDNVVFAFARVDGDIIMTVDQSLGKEFVLLYNIKIINYDTD